MRNSGKEEIFDQDLDRRFWSELSQLERAQYYPNERRFGELNNLAHDIKPEPFKRLFKILAHQKFDMIYYFCIDNDLSLDDLTEIVFIYVVEILTNDFNLLYKLFPSDDFDITFGEVVKCIIDAVKTCLFTIFEEEKDEILWKIIDALIDKISESYSVYIRKELSIGNTFFYSFLKNIEGLQTVFTADINKELMDQKINYAFFTLYTITDFLNPRDIDINEFKIYLNKLFKENKDNVDLFLNILNWYVEPFISKFYVLEQNRDVRVKQCKFCENLLKNKKFSVRRKPSFKCEIEIEDSDFCVCEECLGFIQIYYLFKILIDILINMCSVFSGFSFIKQIENNMDVDSDQNLLNID